MVAEGPGKLRTLKINFNDLRGVDLNAMTGAVNSDVNIDPYYQPIK